MLGSFWIGTVCGAEPCISGPQVGQRPGPYAFTIATGPERGQPFCYICDTADKPAIIFLARRPSDALGQLVAKVDGLVSTHKSAQLRSWVTFLGEQHDLEAIARWGKTHGLRSIPLGVFDDPDGPPTYRIAKDAEVTVLLFVQQKVQFNFAFRAGELRPQAIEAICAAVPKLLSKK